MRTIRLTTVILLVAMAAVLSADVAAANGKTWKKTQYEAAVRMGNGGKQIVFSAELDEPIFKITSVQNKYKVVHIKINNRSADPLPLSLQNDMIEVVMGAERLTGILDLRKVDATMWNAFPQDLRNELAYPQVVKNGEEQDIVVFIAKPALLELPTEFRYTVQSLPNKLVVLVVKKDVSGK